jgi:hypothetical protein
LGSGQGALHDFFRGEMRIWMRGEEEQEQEEEQQQQPPPQFLLGRGRIL